MRECSVLSESSFVWAGQHGYHLMIVPFAGSLDRTAAFVRTYRAIKETEYETFMGVISPWEREYLLLSV